MSARKGRKSVAQTPAPKSDRIKGSKTNKPGSAASKASAKSIQLSEKVVKTLKDKADKYNETHSSKVSVNTLKAVFRRGSGAYSTSHRPTITGGAPNSRNAWSFARVNKFLLKKGGTKVKAAYVQDDDLMANGGMLGKTYNDKELLERYKKGESIGFTGVAHLKAKGLIPRADGTKRKSEKYMENGGQLKNSDMQLLAPNGKKSNLTPMQYKLVRTPQFKAWFGDWENDPQNASKVVDENGEPMVCYHRTDKKFTTFDKEKLGQQSGWATAYFGFYFSNKNNRGSYGKKIMKCFLNIRNPYFIQTETYSDFDYDYKRFDPSNFKNNDGIYIKADRLVLDEKADKHFVAFEPNQIKLADGTNTTFDINDPDIRYSKGGKTYNDKELLSKWKKGESIGFTGESHLKAKGLIPRADGHKRKSEKYMENGGQLGKEVICVNCSWYWNTNQSEDSDKYVCHKCGFDNTLFYSTEIMENFDEFADKRLQGAEKITNDSKEKGGLSMLTYYHYNAKLPTYEQASKGGFDLEKAKQEFDLYYSQLSYNMKQIEFQELMGKMEVLGELIIEEMSIQPEVMNTENGTFEEEFKEGGVVVGKRHSEEDENGTGERFLVESTGQVVEVEGGEGVLSKESMNSDHKYDLDGEKMTGKQIASKLNHKYGGVEFAEGGEVGHVCGCRSKYYHGGELPSATLQGLSGGEAVVTVKTMESKDLYTFQGKKMTPRQILSKINADSGGKKFEEGGTIDLTKNNLEKHNKLTKMVYFTENILHYK